MMQRKDGAWEFPTAHWTTGATSLAGMTLLECGADANDPAVLSAAQFVRAQYGSLRWTYSISLAIMFLDRLGNPADDELIEALAARLVAGQLPSGTWTYQCPDPVAADRLFSQLVARDRSGARPGKEGRRKDEPDSDRKKLAFAQRVALLRQQGGAIVVGHAAGDNSNTQFAILALWVCRRHGLPVEHSLAAVVRHFRDTQVHDGEWMYDDAGMYGGPSATMTCAGLLGVTIGHGLTQAKMKDVDPAAEKAPDADKGKGAENANKAKPKKAVGLSDDQRVRAGLLALSQTIGLPLERLPPSPPEQGGVKLPKGVAGRSIFLLWSIERVAVLLGLDTIGGKDWYEWGAGILLAAQSDKGTWEGSYGQGGVDTCFALLFLRKVNLLNDLSKLTGRARDPGQRVLRARPGGLTPGPAAKGGGESDPAPRTVELPDPGRTLPSLPSGPVLGDSESGKLAAALVGLPVAEQGAEIERLRDQKGAVNTEALAAAIPFLSPDSRHKARVALAEREARMRLETIGRDLRDENPEIRGAAARACGLKGGVNKETWQFIPQLIEMLSDREVLVARAAYATLKDLTGEDFGPDAGADEAGRKQAVEKWQAWWKKQSH
jgi:hypothetical protein